MFHGRFVLKLQNYELNIDLPCIQPLLVCADFASWNIEFERMYIENVFIWEKYSSEQYNWKIMVTELLK